MGRVGRECLRLQAQTQDAIMRNKRIVVAANARTISLRIPSPFKSGRGDDQKLDLWISRGWPPPAAVLAAVWWWSSNRYLLLPGNTSGARVSCLKHQEISMRKGVVTHRNSARLWKVMGPHIIGFFRSSYCSTVTDCENRGASLTAMWWKGPRNTSASSVQLGFINWHL